MTRKETESKWAMPVVAAEAEDGFGLAPPNRRLEVLLACASGCSQYDASRLRAAQPRHLLEEGVVPPSLSVDLSPNSIGLLSKRLHSLHLRGRRTRNAV